MKSLITILLTFIFVSSKSQEIDSALIARTYLEGFTRDTGLTLQEPRFTDEKGRKRTLSEFKGKIIYIDMWTTWCVNCIANFPLSKKLLERLKSIHLDTAIQFINICTEDSKSQWKKIIKSRKPEGINLYTSDTSIYKSWHIEAFPTYILLDRYGKIMASHAPDVRDGYIDYILYAATKNIKPAISIWVDFKQKQYFRKHHSYTTDTEGIDYAKWFSSTVEERVAYFKWQEQQRKNNSR